MNVRLLSLIVVAILGVLASAGPSWAQGRVLAGTACGAGADLAGQGNAVEPRTGRAFFLDYPCDLKADEPVLFILSLHGGGSSGSWQRRYFPAFDLAGHYRLVIATPTAAGSGQIAAGGRGARMWIAENDDEHVRNVVDFVIDAIGPRNIKAFWLAGHSQGGMTSNRIVCSDYFKDKVDGWLSLSGGRIGAATIPPDFFGANGPPASLQSSDPNTPRPGFAAMPGCDISYIFASGELEIMGLPDGSPMAERYGCGPRVRRPDIVDEQKGYVTGASPGRPASWGREARPGTAQVYEYPNCAGGRIVADVLRMDKGHTEGLEPRVTEALVRMMAAAPGGKIRASSYARVRR
jgi:hypothetical protein